jgi:4'-phosphopantetheinyl transferase
MVKLFFSGYDRSSPDDLMRLRSLSASEDKADAARYKDDDDRMRTLLGRLLARYGLRKYFGLNSVRLLRDEHDRPYVAGHRRIDFNISHSGHYAACAVCDTERVGIDIEWIRPLIEDVTSFFAKEEIDYLSALGGNDRLEAFYRIWTAKESYVKADGKTFLLPLNEFGFSFEDAGRHPRLNGRDGRRFAFTADRIDGRYVFTCCYGSRESEPAIEFADFPNLLRYVSG